MNRGGTPNVRFTHEFAAQALGFILKALLGEGVVLVSEVGVRLHEVLRLCEVRQDVKLRVGTEPAVEGGAGRILFPHPADVFPNLNDLEIEI